MIFTIIMLSIGLVGFFVSLLTDVDIDSKPLLFVILASISIVFILVLVAGTLETAETKSIILEMRNNPQNFTIQDASEINTELAKINMWKDTIFTFFRGFDTTLLDLSKFVSI